MSLLPSAQSFFSRNEKVDGSDGKMHGNFDGKNSPGRVLRTMAKFQGASSPIALGVHTANFRLMIAIFFVFGYHGLSRCTSGAKIRDEEVKTLGTTSRGKILAYESLGSLWKISGHRGSFEHTAPVSGSLMRALS